MVSLPSTFRSLLLGTLVGAAAFYTMMVKLDGGPARETFAPAWLAGVLPNLAAAFALPLAPLIPPRVVRYTELLRLAALVVVGLTAYEVLQLQMPRRTFDWYDIFASILGAAAAVGLGRALFFRPAIAQ